MQYYLHCSFWNLIVAQYHFRVESHATSDKWCLYIMQLALLIKKVIQERKTFCPGWMLILMSRSTGSRSLSYRALMFSMRILPLVGQLRGGGISPVYNSEIGRFSFTFSFRFEIWIEVWIYLLKKKDGVLKSHYDILKSGLRRFDSHVPNVYKHYLLYFLIFSTCFPSHFLVLFSIICSWCSQTKSRFSSFRPLLCSIHCGTLLLCYKLDHLLAGSKCNFIRYWCVFI